jgi:hypothetical protein
MSAESLLQSGVCEKSFDLSDGVFVISERQRWMIDDFRLSAAVGDKSNAAGFDHLRWAAPTS